jgi:hypothetical protein
MSELRTKLEEAIDSALSDEVIEKAVKKVREASADLASELEYCIKADLPYNFAAWTERMAQEAVEAILKGDEDTMRARLSCREGYYTGRDRDHPVIHGKLFETGALELRKKIVDAHPDLLKNERILDLEDQVRSLVEQVNTLERENGRVATFFAGLARGTITEEDRAWAREIVKVLSTPGPPD